jgi:putative FmdB family regulatory protein
MFEGPKVNLARLSERRATSGGRLEFCFLSRRMPTAAHLAAQPMPTYEYHCEKCGKNFELFQSMRDQPLAECPKEHCQQKKWGHGKVKRQIGTGAGLIFKGSGFYITDYRSKNYQEGAKKEAPATPSAEKSSGSKEGSAGTATPAATPAKTTESKPKKPANE